MIHLNITSERHICLTHYITDMIQTSRTTHTGEFLSYDERFEHPARTWTSSSHRKFTHAAVGIAMAAATF
jgi:hypothetical protein